MQHNIKTPGDKSIRCTQCGKKIDIDEENPRQYEEGVLFKSTPQDKSEHEGAFGKEIIFCDDCFLKIED